MPGIKRLSRIGLPVTLAISLHAPTDELRRSLIPGFTRYSVDEIIDAGRDYVSITGRRLTIEYCLLHNVNDRPADAQQLATLLKGLNCHVNLIPFNPVAGLPYLPSPPKKIKGFLTILTTHKIQITERVRKGVDIEAACGQLRRRHC